MARPAKVSDEMIQTARQIVQKAKTAREIRCGLSVLIPRICNVTNKETADVLDLGVATVARMQKQIRNQVNGMKEDTKFPCCTSIADRMVLDIKFILIAKWNKIRERGPHAL